MAIFYDPTEGRISTAIPKIDKYGKPMPGLEAATACDIAIFEDAKGIHPDFLAHSKSEEIARLHLQGIEEKEIVNHIKVPIPVVRKVLKTLDAAFRGVLIQRKSGGDAISSVPSYSRILEKMLVWTPSPWLLVTGSIESDKSGRTIVNGRKTDFPYAGFQGALEAWQFRGGYFSHVHSDDDVYDFLTRTEKKINERQPQKVVFVRQPHQTIVGPEDDDAWISTLMTFSGIGSEMGKKLAENFGTLAAALCFMSDETALSWKVKPHGFGPITLQHARNRLGLLPGQRLQIAEELKIDD